jgi:cytochrome c-type biogenesis protein CcmE
VAVIDPPAGGTGPTPGEPAPGSDAADLDLSPRPVPARKRRKGWAAKIAVVAVLVAAGFIVSKALTSATLFFYNANEAVAKQKELGTSTFRIQGTVENDVRRTSDGADFTITYEGVEVPVDHVGDPPQLFQPGEPVVLQGHWDPDGQRLFLSNTILVKHSATYTAQNGARLKQAVEGGKVPPKTSTTVSSGPGSSVQP